MKLNLRPLLLLLAVLLLFSVGMASLLNYFKFESTVKKLQRDRIGLIAHEVEKAVQRGNSLGAELATNTTIQAMIERQLKSDALLLAIDIFDENGKTLFSTDKTHLNKPAPAAWSTAAYRVKTSRWAVTESDAFVTGIVLKNSFDLTTGSVAVRYGRAALDREVAGMGTYIAQIGAITGAVAFVLCGAGFGLLSATMRRDAARAELAFDRHGSAVSSAIEHDVVALQTTADAAGRQIADIDRALAPGVSA